MQSFAPNAAPKMLRLLGIAAVALVAIIEPDFNNWFGTDVKLHGLAEVKYEFIAPNEDTGTDYSDSGYTEYGIKYKDKWYFADYLSGMQFARSNG